jgi:hypothetical protein
MPLNIENAQSEIQDYVARKIGINVPFTVTEEPNRFDETKSVIHLNSEDFAHLMTPRIFKELRITDFGTATDIDSDGEKYHTLNLNYRYKHFDSGSNGCSLSIIVLNDNGEIIASETAEERNS